MSGVAGIYPGGVIWGVRAALYGDKCEPEIFRWANEGDARKYLASCQAASIAAELVAARLHWQVQE